MKEKQPDTTLPKIYADFNSRGYSGEPDDNCCYVLLKEDMDQISPAPGLRVFLYMDEGEGEIVGCEATLESYEGGWRGRVDEATWYNGPDPFPKV